MEQLRSAPHHPRMAKGKHWRHYLREWRGDRSLEEVARRIEELSQEWASAGETATPRTMTHATLSRIERGKLPYNQHLLELLANIYGTDPASLIMRDPTDPDGLWTVADGLTPGQRAQLVEMAKVIKRTGTAG